MSKEWREKNVFQFNAAKKRPEEFLSCELLWETEGGADEHL